MRTVTYAQSIAKTNLFSVLWGLDCVCSCKLLLAADGHCKVVPTAEGRPHCCT